MGLFSVISYIILIDPNSSFVKISFLSAVYLIVLFIWFITYRLPRIKNGKMGIVIAIEACDIKTFEELKNNLHLSFKSLFKNSDMSNDFDIVYLKPYHFNKLFNLDKFKSNKKYQMKIMNKTHAQYFIFGRCYKSKKDSIQNYIIEIDSAVIHKDVTFEIHKRLSGEFSELLFNHTFEKLLRNKLCIPEGNEALDFQTLSIHLEIVAKYIIARAFLISGNLSESMVLFIDIYNEIKEIMQPTDTQLKIISRSQEIIYGIHGVYLRVSYLKFTKTLDMSNIDDMNIYLENSIKYISNSSIKLEAIYDYAVNKALYYFLKSRNIEAAKKIMQDKCQKINGSDWRYSMAFLYSYEGNLTKAYQEYKKAFKIKTRIPNIVEIEEFINIVLESEPEKTDLHFSLGFINYNVKKDYAIANEEFLLFLSKASPNSIINNITNDMLSEIKKYNFL